MDIGDYIFAIQTLLVAISGGIVCWYTFETHRLRKTAQRQIQISAKTAILAAKMQYLVAMEEKNNIFMSMGRHTAVDTHEIENRINALQAEIDRTDR
jgi:hypothetical protein